MKILVTGLTLEGNKGGAALALSIKEQLNKYINNLDIYYSVSPNTSFENEYYWAKKYDVNVVKRFVYADALSLGAIIHVIRTFKKIFKWFSLLKGFDLIIDLSALSYVGPPEAGNRKIYRNSRFSYFLSSLVMGKQFLAWTQSYGPLSTPVLRFMAKYDLKRQPVIFCRGENSLDVVKKLLPKKNCVSFPDVANILDYKKMEGEKYILQKFGKIDFKKLIAISPSSILYSRSNNYGFNRHLDCLINLSKILIQKGYIILFVPHTFRKGAASPSSCDSKIGELVKNSFSDSDRVFSINEDLSVILLKSIISSAYVHIGARYHSLVAALSTGVPCIALSWHPKYSDIMKLYGLDNFIYNDNEEDLNDLILMFEDIIKNRELFSNILFKKRKEINSEIEKNTKMFINLIKVKESVL